MNGSKASVKRLTKDPSEQTQAFRSWRQFWTCFLIHVTLTLVPRIWPWSKTITFSQFLDILFILESSKLCSFVHSHSMSMWAESLLYHMKGQWYWRGSSEFRLPADTGVDLAHLSPTTTWSKCSHMYTEADSQPAACKAQEKRSTH